MCVAVFEQVGAYPVTPGKQTSYFFKLLFWSCRGKWQFLWQLGHKSQSIFLVFCVPISLSLPLKNLQFSLWLWLFSETGDLQTNTHRQPQEHRSQPDLAGKTLNRYNSSIKPISKPFNSADITKMCTKSANHSSELAHTERSSCNLVQSLWYWVYSSDVGLNVKKN